LFSNRRQLQIEWGQCDPAGIVFFPRYFEMFDAATAALFAAATGISKAQMIADYDIIGIPMIKSEASYAAPCRFGDAIEIVTRITSIGRSSIAIEHRLSRGVDVSVEAREWRVWTGRDAAGVLASMEIPAAVRSALSTSNSRESV
jgi:4-hydroxybenzoyl-CoA thioesterase